MFDIIRRFISSMSSVLGFDNAPEKPLLLTDGTPILGSPKKVRFSDFVKVVLIPTREDFEKAGLATTLWRSEEEHRDTSKEASDELRAHILFRRSEGRELNWREAAAELYQPKNDLEDLDSEDPNSTPQTVMYSFESSKSINNCSVVSKMIFFQPLLNPQAASQIPTISPLMPIETQRHY